MYQHNWERRVGEQLLLRSHPRSPFAQVTPWSFGAQTLERDIWERMGHGHGGRRRLRHCSSSSPGAPRPSAPRRRPRRLPMPHLLHLQFIYFNYSPLKASMIQELHRFTAPVLQPAQASSCLSLSSSPTECHGSAPSPTECRGSAPGPTYPMGQPPAPLTAMGQSPAPLTPVSQPPAPLIAMGQPPAPRLALAAPRALAHLAAATTVGNSVWVLTCHRVPPMSPFPTRQVFSLGARRNYGHRDLMVSGSR